MSGLFSCSDAQPGAEFATSPETRVVWRAGAGGYHTYRIPVALATPGGALLAFAEGRRTARGDAGDIDLLVKRSTDGGRLDPSLIEPVCQASLRRYGWPDMQHPRGILLFSNPAGATRERMTVRASFDDGATWPVEKLIEAGSSAYSSLVRLADGRVGLLYERADYREIVFTAFPLDWLLEE